ncbi:polymer-forming cytoskeletal protein [Sinimarinibacterium sp. NLF-5-8]|uniref:bactofilin family protein n=1 Tax=Sinimarinibacterium sp. NLF-5-8 TaxID=2698684 RepID=UPI001EE3B145|nr:polymer-forming cytoskeletal protein [Sinimarinibacterium sp. NLF-5-8]
MSMFGGSSGKNKPASSVSVETLIGRQTEILGDIHFTGGLHIDGRVKGKVIASADKASALSVSEHGAIEGDVRVPTVVLNGSVTGDVHASQKVSISAKARVSGNVFYRAIEMESGAQVNGQLVHEADTETTAESARTGKNEPNDKRLVKQPTGV